MSDRTITLLHPLKEMLYSCIENCDPICCGVDSFEFSSARFRAWLVVQGRARRAIAKRRLEVLLESLKNDHVQGVTSSELNAHWSLQEAVEFFSDLNEKCAEALAGVEDDGGVQRSKP